MAKKRKAIRRPKSPRKSSKPVKGRKQQPLELAKSSLTIRFRTESELVERLAELTTLFSVGRAAGGTLEAAGGLDSCLSLIPAARVVASALSPKNFLPTEKLGETYLTSQERELFKARVVRGVKAAGCQIADGDVPAEESTTHSAVVMALRQNAHV
jgi:hypothetical protein